MRNQAHRPLTESTAYGLVWFLISSLTVALAWQLLGLGQSVFVFFFFLPWHSETSCPHLV